jgi:hypothetical protein
LIDRHASFDSWSDRRLIVFRHSCYDRWTSRCRSRDCNVEEEKSYVSHK